MFNTKAAMGTFSSKAVADYIYKNAPTNLRVFLHGAKLSASASSAQEPGAVAFDFVIPFAPDWSILTPLRCLLREMLWTIDPKHSAEQCANPLWPKVTITFVEQPAIAIGLFEEAASRGFKPGDVADAIELQKEIEQR